MTWERTVNPLGVVHHRLEGFVVEGIPSTSTHGGYVFGQFLNDADRPSVIRSWTAYAPSGAVIASGKLKQCKAAVERRIGSAV